MALTTFVDQTDRLDQNLGGKVEGSNPGVDTFFSHELPADFVPFSFSLHHKYVPCYSCNIYSIL